MPSSVCASSWIPSVTTLTASFATFFLPTMPFVMPSMMFLPTLTGLNFEIFSINFPNHFTASLIPFITSAIRRMNFSAKLPFAAIANRSASSTPLVIHPTKTPILWIVWAMPITKFSMKLPFICKSKRSVSETPFLIQPTKIAISLMMFPIAVTAAAAKFATLSPIDLKELNHSVSIPKAVFWFSLPSPRTATEIASKPITARPATG